MHIARQYGGAAILRGLIPCAIRDGIYVGGLLGITPVLQDYLMDTHGFGMAAGGRSAPLPPPRFPGTS